MQAGPGAQAILLEAASSTEQATRLVALAGLARLDTEEALSTLGAAIADVSAEVQAAAVSLLADREDEGAAAVLVDAALRSEPAHPVQRALSRPGSSRVVAILNRLATADERGAPVLVAALARMGLDMATAALFEALAMTNPAARAAAASSLVSLGVDGAVRAVSALAANDPDPEVRRVCAAALASA
jgi:HEAT repeat protein